MMNTCMIYATAGSPEEARTLAKMLVEANLVACVNILDGATSVYRWDGISQFEEESILIAKTSVDRRSKAMARLKDLHSYETPCIVSYDMADGTPDYLDWIVTQTTSG